jgi:hypothetical protein
MDWKHLLAYITGTVDQELLLRNEYLVTGNCILKHLGYTMSDQTMSNILKRHGILPAPERKKTTTWQEFIRTHMEVLVATVFFTAEVWTTAGLATYYVLFFIHLASRKVHVAGMTPHPDERWMVQIARAVGESMGLLRASRRHRP